MEFVDLILKMPGVRDALSLTTVSGEDIERLCGEITRQLREEGEDDLTDLLSILNARRFVSMIDWSRLAGNTGIERDLTESFVAVVAIAVEGFAGGRDRSDSLRCDTYCRPRRRLPIERSERLREATVCMRRLASRRPTVAT